MSLAREIHVGTPPGEFPLEESIKIHFHDFAKLPSRKGDIVKSAVFRCAGYDWTLWLYPGGESNAKEGRISVYLRNETKHKTIIDFDSIIIKTNGEEYIKKSGSHSEYGPYSGLGWSDFAVKSNLLNTNNGILSHGTLTFVVNIRPEKSQYCYPSQQPSSIGEDIFKLFGDEESVDVSFKVKRRVFYAHKSILKVRVAELAELSEQFDKNTRMPIKDVEPEVFEIMLKYIYGKNIVAEEWKENSKQILRASGKYGFVTLKEEADAWCVKNLNLSADTAVDELICADGTDCVFLRKAVIDFIIDNGPAVLASDSYNKLDESPRLRKEIMMEFAKSNESNKRKRDA